MALVCVNPPIVEPVSLSELKDYLRLDQDDTSQDGVLTSLNMAARSWCETISRRKFVQQTWAFYADFFPGYIDTKLTGQMFSSPFVSGANAVLVGIRYAVLLPFPPIQSLNSFVYQNANGQVTSMILGPTTISSVSNPLGNPVSVVTAAPHGLQSGATATLAGNAALLAVLANQVTQVITVVDPYTLQFNGSIGTGSAIAGGGTITGYNFVQDLLSEPPRLTPIFGQVWPVARVVVNAIQLNFTVGYAVPLTGVTTTVGNAALGGYTSFTASNVGQPISIPGAGDNGGALNTIIASVNNGVGSVRDQPSNPVQNATALLVSHGKPAHWEAIKLAIKFLVNAWFVNRMPNLDPKSDALMAARRQLGMAIDLRV